MIDCLVSQLPGTHQNSVVVVLATGQLPCLLSLPLIRIMDDTQNYLYTYVYLINHLSLVPS